jgi:hypothetical protein
MIMSCGFFLDDEGHLWYISPNAEPHPTLVEVTDNNPQARVFFYQVPGGDRVLLTPQNRLYLEPITRQANLPKIVEMKVSADVILMRDDQGRVLMGSFGQEDLIIEVVETNLIVNSQAEEINPQVKSAVRLNS